MSTAGDAAERLWDEHLAQLLAGASAPAGREVKRMPWLEFALNPIPDLFAAPPGGMSAKVKDALLKKRLTDRQIGVVYDYLTGAGSGAGSCGSAGRRRTWPAGVRAMVRGSVTGAGDDSPPIRRARNAASSHGLPFHGAPA